MKMTCLHMLVFVMVAAQTFAARERPDGWVPLGKGKKTEPVQFGDCDKPCGAGSREESNREWTLSCNTFPCGSPLSCVCGQTDLLFILDNTGSINLKNSWIQKQFAVDIAKGMEKHGKMDQTSVGLVTFDDSSAIEFNFGDGYGFSDITRLEDRLWTTAKRNGHTNTAAGLRTALQMFEGQQSTRKKVAILFTDGASNIDKNQTIPTAERLHEAGVSLFVIGIGNIKEAELKGIASKPTENFYFYASTFRVMETIISQVMDGLCCAVPPPKCNQVSASPCSEPCDGGISDVVSICVHYGFGGVVLKTETVMEQLLCNEDTCPTTVTCNDQDQERVDGDKWLLQCSCTSTGKSVCVEADPTGEPVCGTDVSLGCGYKGSWHAPSSTWVETADGGRQKACVCPDPVPDNWKLKDYCLALCVFNGTNYYDGDTFTYPEGDATIRCRCTKYSKLDCKVQGTVGNTSSDAARGCRLAKEWHAPGAQWVQLLSEGRKKACTCTDPPPETFHISENCKAICEDGNKLYQYGDAWTRRNKETGARHRCRCKRTGRIRCTEKSGAGYGATDAVKGCRWGGSWHEPGTTWIQANKRGQEKECTCTDPVPEKFFESTECRPVCSVGSVKYEAGEKWKETDPETGTVTKCRCKPSGRVRCVEKKPTGNGSTHPIKGCRWASVWHAPDTQWIETSKSGRKKSCSCSRPVPESFDDSTHCKPVCEFGREIYEVGDTWSGTNPDSGAEQYCRCKDPGRTRCVDTK